MTQLEARIEARLAAARWILDNTRGGLLKQTHDADTVLLEGAALEVCRELLQQARELGASPALLEVLAGYAGAGV